MAGASSTRRAPPSFAHNSLSLVLLLASAAGGVAKLSGAPRSEATTGTARRLSLDRVQRPLVGSSEGRLPDAFHPSRWQPLVPSSSVKDDSAASGSRSFPAPPLHLVQESLSAAGGIHGVRKSMTNVFDSIYLVTADVGNPAKEFKLVVDTGSSDLWISWASKFSSTTIDEAKPDVLLQYGQGQVLGNKVDDWFCLRDLCVENQTIVAAEAIADLPTGKFFDGLLGLAYPGLSSAGPGRDTFLARLLKTTTWKHLSFGLSLRFDADSEGSFLVFGDFDTVMAQAPADAGVGVALQVVPMTTAAQTGDPNVAKVVTQDEFWLVAGQLTILVPPMFSVISQGFFAILDSGTTLLSVPYEMYPIVMEGLIKPEYMPTCAIAMNILLCPCATPLQSLNFNFKDKDGQLLTVTVGPDDLLQPMGEAQLADGSALPMCRVNLQQGSPNMPFWILGDVFLRKVYVVHDVLRQQVVLFNGQPADTEPAATEPHGVIASGQQMSFAAIGLRLLMLFGLVALFLLWQSRRQVEAREVYIRF